MRHWSLIISAIAVVAAAATLLPLASSVDRGPGAASSAGAIDDRPIWQTIGSAGTADERSSPKLKLTGPRCEVKSSGEVTMRYNVLPVAETDEFVNGITMAVRYRDNGSKAHVVVVLRELGLDGGLHTVARFDSNDYARSNHPQLRAVEVCGFEFDFYNNLYYVDAHLDKGNGSGKPALDAIQILGLECDG